MSDADDDDNITEALAGAASAASGAAGSAASAVGKAAKSAVGVAMSAFGQGPESSSRLDFETQKMLEAREPQGGEKSGPDMKDLGADIARFRAREDLGREQVSAGESFALGAKDLISTIITVDFFVVIAFMLWFIAGVVGTYAFDNTFLLDEFNESWTPIVQPALGVLMAGTIAGGVVSKFGGESEDDNKGNMR